jgi:hypothetical protein
MKTAMQELIDELKIESNFITKDDHIEDRMFKKGIDLAIYISNHLLEKEKEQILEAVKFGQNNHTVSIPEDEMIAKNYFNDKYEVVEEYNQNK